MSQKKIVYYKGNFPKFIVPIAIFFIVLAFLFFAFFGIIAFVIIGVLAIGASVIKSLLKPFKKKKIKNYDSSTDTYTLDESEYKVIKED